MPRDLVTLLVTVTLIGCRSPARGERAPDDAPILPDGSALRPMEAPGGAKARDEGATGPAQPADPGDAGASHLESAQIWCDEEKSAPADGLGLTGLGRPALLPCRFGGVVRALVPATRPRRPPEKGRIHGVRVTLDHASSVACKHLVLGGFRGSEGTDPRRLLREDNEIFVALPAGFALPFREGDSLCGSVRSLSLGYDSGTDALVARPNGDVLVAYSDAVPREPSPLPGWTFTLGPQEERTRRDEDYWYMQHGVRALHGGHVATSSRGGASELRGTDGTFSVRASGYRTAGKLPPWMTWLGTEGYGFWVIRI